MAASGAPSRALAPAGGLPEIVDEVAALAPARRLLDPELVSAAARAWSANTVRAFLSDLRLWDRWYRGRVIAVGLAGAGDVAAYVRALSGDAPGEVRPRAAATIARYLVNIGWAYRMAGRDDPTAAPLVRLELKAARKERGVRQKQARGIRFAGDVLDLDGPALGICLAHLLAACGRDWAGLRDAALLRTAYDTGCRRSELVAITVDQIDGPDGEGAGTLLIPRSKTDREGEGRSRTSRRQRCGRSQRGGVAPGSSAGHCSGGTRRISTARRGRLEQDRSMSAP